MKRNRAQQSEGKMKAKMYKRRKENVKDERFHLKHKHIEKIYEIK
jgi:hypothetical protein